MWNINTLFVINQHASLILVFSIQYFVEFPLCLRASWKRLGILLTRFLIISGLIYLHFCQFFIAAAAAVVQVVVVVVLGFATLLTFRVISVAFCSELEKTDKFCSEALISAWGSFTCRKSTTWDPRLYFTSEGSHTQDFYALKKIHRPRPGLNTRSSDPVASMITTGPPRFFSSVLEVIGVCLIFPLSSSQTFSIRLMSGGCAGVRFTLPQLYKNHKRKSSALWLW